MIFTKLLLTGFLLFPIKHSENSKRDVQHARTINEESILDFTYSFIPAAGVTIFKASTTIAKDLIQKCRWDFGDNTYSEEHSPQHFYESPGVYSVTFTIILKTGLEKSVSKPVSWLVNN
jgi:PKD repeat protein